MTTALIFLQSGCDPLFEKEYAAVKIAPIRDFYDVFCLRGKKTNTPSHGKSMLIEPKGIAAFCSGRAMKRVELKAESLLRQDQRILLESMSYSWNTKRVHKLCKSLKRKHVSPGISAAD